MSRGKAEPDRETIALTNPRSPGTYYRLVLTYDQAAPGPGGEAPANAKSVIAARIDTGTASPATGG